MERRGSRGEADDDEIRTEFLQILFQRMNRRGHGGLVAMGANQSAHRYLCSRHHRRLRPWPFPYACVRAPVRLHPYVPPFIAIDLRNISNICELRQSTLHLRPPQATSCSMAASRGLS